MDTCNSTAELNAAVACQAAASLPLLSVSLLSPPCVASHRDSGQQLRAELSAEIMKQTLGYILLESVMMMLIRATKGRRYVTAVEQAEHKLAEMWRPRPLCPQQPTVPRNLNLSCVTQPCEALS